MRIDFHTHTFPEAIAARTIAKLEKSARTASYADGTADGLRASMERAGIDFSVILPVATRPGQAETINRVAIETNDRHRETGLVSFGGIHPDNADYRQILRSLAENGIRGIKLHPVYQQTYFDDIRYMRIIDCACENGLTVVTHAGYDISFPGGSQAVPKRILAVLDTVKPDKLVLAHMGGWRCWDEVEQHLAGAPVWLDTSFTATPIRPAADTCRTPEECYTLSPEQFCRIIRRHGAGRVLFGSDSPWSDQDEAITLLTKSGLAPEECTAILGGNAEKLLFSPAGHP